MINKDLWIEEILKKLKEVFATRLLFVGLQGSYVRNEATETSDFDLVVVLDTLDINDLKTYRAITETMPEYEKACGFIGGKEELANWPGHELLQFAKETVAYYGSLDSILPPLTEEDVKTGVKNSASAIYHAACHTYVHAPKDTLHQNAKAFYKGAAFIVQMLCFVKTGEYIPTKKELLTRATGEDYNILSLSMNFDNSALSDEELYGQLISWCGKLIIETGK
ncbi:hypothetical protein Dip510_001867 [Elusimicrobium posterum]|uniref:nucleotidyltransferase domain-containing protein n=1 Tax=Elusimicrobium posterum TaxID=3116653 RepID=UPI003C788D4A